MPHVTAHDAAMDGFRASHVISDREVADVLRAVYMSTRTSLKPTLAKMMAEWEAYVPDPQWECPT